MLLDFVSEQDVWERLKNIKKPIVMYGMGDGAQKILDVFKTYQIPLAGIFASDEFVRGHSFLGYKVHTYREICEQYDDFLVVLAFASRLPTVLEKIQFIHSEHEVVAPDVPVAGKGLFTNAFVKAHLQEFLQAYQLMADQKSREVFSAIVNFKISGKIDYLLKCTSEKSEVYHKILKIRQDEFFVDLGAYDGDTIREFLHASNGQYRRILALEPDQRNFQKLESFVIDSALNNIQIYNMGIWNEKAEVPFSFTSGRNAKVSRSKAKKMIAVDALDHLLQEGEAVSYIKIDVEGCEMRALQGAKRVITQYNPKLYVCAYHRNEDLFALPLFIRSLSPAYKIYLRHSPYIPAWETNYYCVL